MKSKYTEQQQFHYLNKYGIQTNKKAHKAGWNLMYGKHILVQNAHYPVCKSWQKQFEMQGNLYPDKWKFSIIPCH